MTPKHAGRLADTSVDPTDARNSETGFRDRPSQPFRYPTTRHVFRSNCESSTLLVGAHPWTGWRRSSPSPSCGSLMRGCANAAETTRPTMTCGMSAGAGRRSARNYRPSCGRAPIASVRFGGSTKVTRPSSSGRQWMPWCSRRAAEGLRLNWGFLGPGDSISVGSRFIASLGPTSESMLNRPTRRRQECQHPASSWRIDDERTTRAKPEP
jgi:hypothetical protein